MNEDKNTKEYLEKLGNVKLSASARQRISDNLDSFADFHAVNETVRVDEASRSTTQVGQTSVWQTALLTYKRRTMHIFVVLALMVVGGGTSLAAQGTVPGDILYPIKVHVNENVRAALAVGADAEARLQADLLAERVEEAERLLAEGRLNGQLATRVESDIATQYERAEVANAEADGETKSETSGRIRLALESFTSVIGSDGSVALDTKAESRSSDSLAYDESDEEASVSMQTNAVVSSDLALEPISVETLYKNVEARLKALVDLLARYRAEIKADVYTELKASLNEAEAELDFLARAGIESEAESREILFSVSEILGEVEATLTRLGTAKIDTETGAIVDIDFSTPPPTEPDRGGAVEIDPKPMPLPLPMPPEHLDVESNTESSGVINL